MSDNYREAQGKQGRRNELHGDLRKNPDWDAIEEYARLRADQLLVQTLAHLHRRIGGWKEFPPHVGPADIVADVEQVLADTLTDAGAAVIESKKDVTA